MNRPWPACSTCSAVCPAGVTAMEPSQVKSVRPGVRVARLAGAGARAVDVQAGAADADGGRGGAETDVAVVGLGDQPGEGADRSLEHGNEEAAFAGVLLVIDEVVHAKAGGGAQRDARVVAESQHGPRAAAGFDQVARIDAAAVHERRRCPEPSTALTSPCDDNHFGAGLHGVGRARPPRAADSAPQSGCRPGRRNRCRGCRWWRYASVFWQRWASSWQSAR